MEGPLETFETPKQDKMISLIAWLIIASLLFYLAVFTFESFLRKSPWFAVTQEISGTEQVETTLVQGDEVISEPVFEETVIEEVNAFASIDADPEVNFREDVPLIQEAPVTSSTVTVQDGSEAPFQNRQEVVSESSFTTLAEEVEDVAPPTSQIVEEIVAPIQMSQVKLESTFLSRSQAFQYLKEMDFGDLDISLELITQQGKVHVLIGGQKAEEEVGRLEKYLRARNHGLGLVRISESDSEVLFQEAVTAEAPSPTPAASAPVVHSGQAIDFDAEASMKPYTIQVGSFLSRRNAVILQERMQEKGYSSKVEEKLQGNTYHYRVLVGNFINRETATSQATKLSEVEDVPVYVRTSR